jgi:octaprenyl-diphosphate synthase
MQTSPPAIARLRALVASDLDITNQFILQHLNSEVELIPTLGTHLINSGGKRLRPILLLIAARLCGYRGDRHALLAAVIEFIHTATLLHDDVVDKSDTRRGRATANAVWGNKAPILVGDFLFSRSFQILVEYADLEVLKVVADTCAIISQGEVMQLVVSEDLETSDAQYMQVVESKTASLFAAAARIGAVVAGQPVDMQERLARYGMLLGTAYQIVDDTLDYMTTRETLGKTIGADFQESKITLPVIHAYSHGDESERQFWKEAIELNHKPEGSLQRAIELIQARGSIEYTMARARQLAREARDALAPFPASPEKEALLELADFAVDRSF